MEKRYNDSQVKAIGHFNGPCLTLAGPGSGKTAVITERTKNLITKYHVNPSNILVITFTKAAALEMKTRFLSLMGNGSYPVTFGTFHAVYFSILKHAYNYNANNIVREEQKYALMRELVQKHRLEYEDETEFVSSILGEISMVKNTGVSIEHYYSTNCAENIFRRIYGEYHEYLHQHKKSMVNQREIGLDSQSYANALRAALREDPDVILVGEMRDFETISVAITAAETGHLVLSTLHTIGAASTVDRVIDVFPPHQQQQIRVQLANVLEAVVSQQLIPKADGSGRVAAFEVLHSNHAVRNLIREGKAYQLMSVMQTNRKQGMMIMDEAIMQLYYSGMIDREMAIQFATDPDGMEHKII